MQAETKSRVEQLTSPAGHDVAVLRFEGDIASTSKDAVLGAYQSVPNQSIKIAQRHRERRMVRFFVQQSDDVEPALVVRL